MGRTLIYLISFIVVLSLLLTNMAKCADPSLVAWYRFDGNALDSSGNQIHGTEIGDPAYDAGVFGQAINLDGDGDYVDCGLAPELDITDFITFTYWIKVVEFDKAWNTVLSRGDDSWRSSRAGTENFMEAAVGGTTGNYTYGVTPVNDGQWHHIGWVYDGTMNYLYVDGVLDASEENSGQITVSSYPLFIGTNSQYTDRTWTGLIDDVMIFNRALTQEEIQHIRENSADAYPKASGPVPADGALHEDTWVNLSWKSGDFAATHDVYFGDNFDDVNAGAEGTFFGNHTVTFLVVGFPGFPFPDGLVPGTTYYWRIDEVEADDTTTQKGDIWSFSIPPRTAYFPDPANGAEFVDPNVELSWTGGFGSKLHTVYFGDNFDDVSHAAGGLPLVTTTYTPGPLELGKTYYWRVDESDAIDTYKGDVWSFTTEGAASSPRPANGAMYVELTPILSWLPGVGASHQLYFGTDEQAVGNADTSSPEYKGPRSLGSESYNPGQLEFYTTYYWRVDEVDSQGNQSKGPLWSFTTGDFIIVEDFESYDDFNNRIFDAWIDGIRGGRLIYGGSQVGYAEPRYVELLDVHGDYQSMPFFYDNTAGVTYSQATLTLVTVRDWTQEDVNVLSLWYKGDSGNPAAEMYVALNDSAVVINDNPDAVRVEEWTPWSIDLQAFADQGVDLTNVNNISIGTRVNNILTSRSDVTLLANLASNGSGKLLFDDMFLIRGGGNRVTLQGTVRNILDGTPVSDPHVSIGNRNSVRTGVGGYRITVTGVDINKNYRVTVSAKDFIDDHPDVWVLARFSERDFVLTPDPPPSLRVPVYCFQWSTDLSTDLGYFYYTLDRYESESQRYQGFRDKSKPVPSERNALLSDPNFTYKGIAFRVWDSNTPNPNGLKAVYRFVREGDPNQIPAYAFNEADLKSNINWLSDDKEEAFFAYPIDGNSIPPDTEPVQSIRRIWHEDQKYYSYTIGGNDGIVVWYAYGPPKAPEPWIFDFDPSNDTGFR
jgi:hypothetical protein